MALGPDDGAAGDHGGTADRRGGEYGWRSPAFGVRQESPVTTVCYKGTLPAVLGAWLDFGSGDARLEAVAEREGWTLSLQEGAGTIEIWFPPEGAPVVHQGAGQQA